VAFSDETRYAIKGYIDNHLADWEWHKDRFSFTSDQALRDRLSDEFISTRYVYKLLEGMAADGWLLRAQIRLQVVSYASVYEAAIHHILFDELSANPELQALTKFKTKKQISILTHKKAVLESALKHDGKEIIATYEEIGRIDESKVRFEKKGRVCR
jgi:hypothetical protein